MENILAEKYLNTMIESQDDEGFGSDEGVRGLKVGERAEWSDVVAELIEAYELPTLEAGVHTVRQPQRTYTLELLDDVIVITRTK